MTKDEYLLNIKKNLTTLTIDEQNQALEYYRDYFEEGGFDEKKVLEELGSPEEVAEKIKEELSNILVKVNKEKSKENKKEYSGGETALYYQFDKEDVKNLNLNFGAADIVCISGDKFSIETRGIEEENLICNLDNTGTLCIKNQNHLQSFNFFSHTKKSGFAPRILISIPDNTSINELNLFIGAGKFETHRIELSVSRGTIEVGAGSCVIDGLNAMSLKAKCSMGNLNIRGRIKGKSYIDCGMGAINLDLIGNIDDYSVDSKVGLGSVIINDNKNEGINKVFTQIVKENHFSVNCGMGSVKIKIS